MSAESARGAHGLAHGTSFCKHSAVVRRGESAQRLNVLGIQNRPLAGALSMQELELAQVVFLSKV